MNTQGIGSLDDSGITFEDTGKLDPICRMIVDPNKSDTASAEYGGTTYFFCSNECKQQFLENPNAFIVTRS